MQEDKLFCQGVFLTYFMLSYAKIMTIRQNEVKLTISIYGYC